MLNLWGSSSLDRRELLRVGGLAVGGLALPALLAKPARAAGAKPKSFGAAKNCIILYLSGGHTIIPGNGLFLTSTSTVGQAGYTYTGLRRWSFNASIGYAENSSIGNVIGSYGGGTATISMSRQISRGVHTVASFTAQRYNSGDFNQYNRTIYYVRLGVGFAPGDVPIRIW